LTHKGRPPSEDVFVRPDIWRWRNNARKKRIEHCPLGVEQRVHDIEPKKQQEKQEMKKKRKKKLLTIQIPMHEIQ
jgi:hypothetical protein